MKHFRIIPNQKIDNRHVNQMLKALNIYKSPLQRWNGRGFDRIPFFSYEMHIQKDHTTFHMTVADEIETIAKKALETAWPDASIDLSADPFQGFEPNAISRLELKHHSMFAIRVDRRENGFMHSLFESLKVMGQDDRIFIQILCIPASLDWYTSAADAYKRFKEGKMPKKIHIDGKELAREGIKLVTRGVLGVIDTIVILTGGTPEKINIDDADRAMMMRDGGLRPETINKTKHDAFDVTICVAIQSKNHENIMKMVAASFREFDGDNLFTSYQLDVNKLTIGWIADRKPGIKLSKDYLSTPELARIIHMPTGPIQVKRNIERIEKTQTSVPSRITTAPGILIGVHTHKGTEQTVFMPIDDWDELCLPRVAIGGMGQGKTKGFGANWLYQAVKNGFGGLAIDPAKGEIGDELAAVLDEDEFIRINIAQNPICLDWCETKHSELARGRLANTMISFFNSNADDAGVQTQRYIRAMVMGIQGNKLDELIRMMNDMAYLQKCVEKMPPGFHRATLEELINYSDARRMQILSPILNRMDMILGDPFLAKCMESDRSLDMVDILRQRKAIVIDVPKKDVGPEGVDIIVNLLSTKIDLAMTLRPDDEQFPFFIVFDEPHQYMRSHTIWKSACVESRKWRVGYVWMFHEWAQIDQNLRKIMKSALPHYHVYPSSKATFLDLKEELQPFELDDFLKLQRWHAINVIRSGGQTITPFIARMTPPPSKQKPDKTDKKENIIRWAIPE